jgi:hypothetical protein
MGEDIPILPALIGAMILTYFGFEVQRRRNKLRDIFNIVEKQESRIAEALEAMVARGELQPYVPGVSRPATP